MRCLHTLAMTLLFGASLAAQAGDATPKASTGAAAKSTPAASATATGTGGSGTTGSAPNAVSTGSSVGDNRSTSGQQISPKKPKCPDPTVACPAEKVIAK